MQDFILILKNQYPQYLLPNEFSLEQARIVQRFFSNSSIEFQCSNNSWNELLKLPYRGKITRTFLKKWAENYLLLLELKKEREAFRKTIE